MDKNVIATWPLSETAKVAFVDENGQFEHPYERKLFCDNKQWLQSTYFLECIINSYHLFFLSREKTRQTANCYIKNHPNCTTIASLCRR